MREAFKNHWPEYLIEGWCLATFMMSACVFGVVLFHPDSLTNLLPFALRSILIGVAMGSTAVAIIRSRWGKRSGAHFNPAVTLTFLRLGKVKSSDALFYVLFQFIGGVTGVIVSYLILGDRLADSAVNFVVTVPGPHGAAAAFVAEIGISFVMMSMILFTTNSARLAPFTPLFGGALVALYISIESPISGMSMNPARSFASAVVANHWLNLWIYFVAPPIAMLAAAECFVRTRGLKSALCAKLDHTGRGRCIFNCSFATEHTEHTEQNERLLGRLPETAQ